MNYLTFKEYQEKVDNWISQFEEGYFAPLEMGVQLMEEVGEVAKEILFLYGHKPRKPNERVGSLEEEISDVLFNLAKICNTHNIDMGEIALSSIEKFQLRDADKYTKKLEG